MLVHPQAGLQPGGDMGHANNTSPVVQKGGVPTCMWGFTHAAQEPRVLCCTAQPHCLQGHSAGLSVQGRQACLCSSRASESSPLHSHAACRAGPHTSHHHGVQRQHLLPVSARCLLARQAGLQDSLPDHGLTCVSVPARGSPSETTPQLLILATSERAVLHDCARRGRHL